jgi:hypothetical protein
MDTGVRSKPLDLKDGKRSVLTATNAAAVCSIYPIGVLRLN